MQDDTVIAEPHTEHCDIAEPEEPLAEKSCDAPSCTGEVGDAHHSQKSASGGK